MLTTKQESLASMLFKEFFRRCPDQKNPTDPNTQEKYNYIVEIGWESLRLMQQARKANTQQNGYPYPWTKADYWQKEQLF